MRTALRVEMSLSQKLMEEDALAPSQKGDREKNPKTIQKLAYQRWWCLVGGLLLQLVAGSVYGFGSFSEQLSQDLGLSDNEIQFIAICGNVGLWTNIVGSIVFNQIGIHAVLFGGSGMVIVAYSLMYLATTFGWPYWVVGIIWFFAGHGSGWMFVAAMFKNAKNFDTGTRGLVVGLLATNFGLSSSLFVSFISSCFGGTVVTTHVWQAHNGSETNATKCQGGFVGNNIEHYMLLAAGVVLVFTVIACLLGMIKKSPSPDQMELVYKVKDKRSVIGRLGVLLGLVCATLVTITTMSLLTLEFPEVVSHLVSLSLSLSLSIP